MDIEKEVLSRIVPNKNESELILKVVEKIKERVLGAAEQIGSDVEPILVGSVAKGTHLIKTDVDIFVMFPPTTSREDLKNNGLKIGESVLENFEKRYAEHPYVNGMFEGINVEIVPCYKIEDPSQKMSAVDRTPFHTSYIIEYLKEEQKDQVRLLKRFLKGIGIYGAEAEIEGFSGYLCELLVLYYGDLRSLIAHAKDWKKGVVNTFDDRKHADFDDSLIVVDPVDPERNVASALSKENFATFIIACREYHAEPKLEFFFPREPTPNSLEELKSMMENRGTVILGIRFITPQTLSDILHSQLRKSVKAISKLCERFGFTIVDSNFFVNDDTMLIFEFEVFSLPSAKPHKGPPVWHPNTSDFLAKWSGSSIALKGPYLRDDCWFVDVKREFRNAKELIVANLGTLDLGSFINESVGREYKILLSFELLDKNYALWLTKFFNKKFSWEY